MLRNVTLPLLAAATASAQPVEPYILFNIDTSGSMSWDVCGSGSIFPDEVDESSECAGSDVACTTCNAVGCGNGIADDGRLWKVKRAVAEVIQAHDDATLALARYHQEPGAFLCPSGAWGGGCNGADILVPFGDDNPQELLDWIDYCDNYPTAGDCDASPRSDAPASGCMLCTDCGTSCDKELRPSGPTPIAASLMEVGQYLIDEVGPVDPAAGCRPYSIVLLTDGEETCGGDPVVEADKICDAGIPVFVIGFASASLQANLDAIADAGCGPACDPKYGTADQRCSDTAFMVDDEFELELTCNDIIQAALLTEVCNGSDDDCDGEVDEGCPAADAGAADVGVILPDLGRDAASDAGAADVAGDSSGVVQDAGSDGALPDAPDDSHSVLDDAATPLADPARDASNSDTDDDAIRPGGGCHCDLGSSERPLALPLGALLLIGLAVHAMRSLGRTGGRAIQRPSSK